MAISCNEEPQWRKESNFANLDILIKDAKLKHIASYNSEFVNKVQFYVDSAISKIDSTSTNSFVESCNKNGVLAVSFDSNYQSSFWVFRFNQRLSCQEGIIISSSGDIEEYCRNLPRPLQLKEIKPGYYWYTDFENRGNFAEDLFSKADDIVFPYPYSR